MLPLPKSLTEGLNPTAPPLFRYVCAICGDYYIRKAQYIKHVALHKSDCTKQLQTEDEHYECAVCKELILVSDFVNHVLSHQIITPSSQVSNRTCIAGINNYRFLTPVISTPTQIDSTTFKCNECPEPFLQKQQINEHLYRHKIGVIGFLQPDNGMLQPIEKGDQDSSVEQKFIKSEKVCTSLNENKLALQENALCDNKSSLHESPESTSESAGSTSESVGSTSESAGSTSESSAYEKPHANNVQNATNSPTTIMGMLKEIMRRRALSSEETAGKSVKRTRSGRIVKPKKLLEDEIEIKYRRTGSKNMHISTEENKFTFESIFSEGWGENLTFKFPNLMYGSVPQGNVCGSSTSQSETKGRIKTSGSSAKKISNISRKSKKAENRELVNVSTVPTSKRLHLSKKKNEFKKVKKEKPCDALASISTNIPQLGSEFVYVGPKTSDINKIKEAIEVIRAKSKGNDHSISSNHSSEVTSNDILGVEASKLTVKASATFAVSATAQSTISQPDNFNDKKCHNIKSVNDKSIQRGTANRNIPVKSKSDILDKNIIGNFVFVKVSPEHMKKIQEQTLELSLIQAIKSKREKELRAILLAQVPPS